MELKNTLNERIRRSNNNSLSRAPWREFYQPAALMTDSKPQSPTPTTIRESRLAAGLTQTAAAHTVRASLRGWQQWEAGDRAMPPGLFELFMLKTGQWQINDDTET